MTDTRATAATDDAQPTGASLREILRERAKVLSEIPATEVSGQKIALLSFRLADELYGIELSRLTETRQSVPLRQIPRAPSHLAGITNLRGELLPVVDLCPILGLPERKFAKTVPALLILSLQGGKLAVAAERAEDILTLSSEDLMEPPISLEPERALLIKGELLINNGLLTLIDVEELIRQLKLARENPKLNLSTEEQ